MSDESTKTRIIEAAGPIFAELGYDGATVREICGACDMNLASINYYFGDKRHLYLDTVRYARKARAERYPFGDWNDESSPAENLYDFISTLLRRLVAAKTAPWQVKLLMREVMNPSGACRDLVQDYFQPIFDSLLRIIDQLVDQPLTQDQRIKIGFSVIGQCLHYRYANEVISMMVSESSRKSHFDVEHLANHITQFSLAGIRHYANLADHTGSTSESVDLIQHQRDR